jgi:hypothetical protein
MKWSDKALRIVGVGWPVIQSAVQLPGITISADGALISGFKIKGVPEDSTAKFNYYMEHPATANLRLDLCQWRCKTVQLWRNKIDHLS